MWSAVIGLRLLEVGRLEVAGGTSSSTIVHLQLAPFKIADICKPLSTARAFSCLSERIGRFGIRISLVYCFKELIGWCQSHWRADQSLDLLFL